MATSLKTAALGGDQEQGFEQSFSALAYAYLRDKAPRLLNFAIGFQLIDKDETKAVGVFGFKVGPMWLYAPVFFLNGELKGHELLYIKQQDVFVPMKENWVNYILGRKPYILGEGSRRDAYQSGGLTPNLDRIVTPPMFGKYSGDMQLDLLRPMLAAAHEKFASFLYRSDAARGAKLDMQKVAAAPGTAALAGLQFDIEQLCRESKQAAKTAAAVAKRYPQIKQALAKFYGPDLFSRIDGHFKDASARASSLLADEPVVPGSLLSGLVKAAAGKPVRIVTDSDQLVTENLNLSDEDKAKLMQHGYLIKDERRGDEVSVAYNTQIEMSLANPSCSGIYELLEVPGKFSKVLVISGPSSNAGPENFMTVVRLDSPKAALNSDGTNLFVRRAESATKDLAEWFDGLDSASVKTGGTYVAINRDGSGTTPFRVVRSIERGGYEAYVVNFDTYTNKSRGPGLPALGRSTREGTYVSSYEATLVCNQREGTKLKALNGELFVPEDTFKFVTVKDPELAESSSPDASIGSRDNGKSVTVNPGNLVDVQMLFMKKTAGLSTMKLHPDGTEVVITTTKRGSERLPWRGALFHLVQSHGLREDQATEMLKAAQASAGVKYRIKYANPFETAGYGPDAPTFPSPEMGSETVGGYNAVNAIYPQEDNIPVPGLDSGRTDPNVYNPFMVPDQRAMGVAQQAASQGQKEIFDTTMLAGLLKTMRQDSLVDKYLGDLMKATDRLGRILFLLYWHGDDFTDRYGKDEMPELEDSVRNAFEAVADVTLFLKEKTIEADTPDTDPNIESTARN